MPRVTLPLRDANNRAVSSVMQSLSYALRIDWSNVIQPKGRARLDDFVETAVFAFADRDRFAGAEIVAQNFREQLPAATDFRREPLADDVTHGVGQADAQLLFFAEREEAEDSVDSLPGVDRVERAQHEVPGFRRHQRHFHRRAVAHFADQNHFRRLAERGPQTVRVIVKIVAELALIEGGLHRRMHEFDRIFQRHDVDGLVDVDLIE